MLNFVTGISGLVTQFIVHSIVVHTADMPRKLCFMSPAKHQCKIDELPIIMTNVCHTTNMLHL